MTAAAYDSVRGILVRYGGQPLDDDTCVPDTWEWDHAGWREIRADPPPTCDHERLAYDRARNLVLLFGGGDANTRLIDGLWSWNGGAWSMLTDVGPPSRAHFGLVYDDAHEQTLLYGGYDGNRVFEDFWSWDGSAWTDLSDRFTGPGPRSHLGLATSPDGMLLFGGATGTSTMATLTNDTWYLTDGAWRALEGHGPSVRGSPALGYDPEREVMLLYGGFDPNGAALADTWEWDGAWRCVDGCA